MPGSLVGEDLSDAGSGDLRDGVRALCARFPSSYWRQLDESRGYPEEFVHALAEGGYLAVLIPEEFGGSGGTLLEASVILEEIHRSGANAAACHAQMYTMGTLLRHGSPEQKEHYLPDIASGKLRLQSFAVTEPDAGSDTLSLTTTARRQGSDYVVNGQKIWTSRVQHSDLMILLARTGPRDEARKRSAGLSVFLVDLRQALGRGLSVQPIETMLNHETNALFFEDLRIPATSLIGKEGEGFRYILDGMNAERILIAAECIGDGDWFLDRGSEYGRTRVVFGKPIGANQGVAFPLARAYARVRAADLMRLRAARLFDRGEDCGPEANMAKLLASEASWEAANATLQTFGGYGFAREYDVERKFRETRLYQVAPISSNLILAYLAHHALDLPRSY
ncbi:MAG TPA: acyl-CoA dehydrogenase family protein [Candidatus Dormibacteraeota bacterium]